MIAHRHGWLTVLVASLALGQGSICQAETTRWTSFQNGGRVAIDADQRPWLHGMVSVWEAEIEGHGQASPIVWDDLVYVTTTVGPEKDEYRLVALEVDSGDVRWTHTLRNPSPVKNSSYVSRAAPTPVADEAGVVVFFEGGALAALTHSGDLRWERDFVADYGSVEARHGLSSSLEQDENHVFVWIERSEAPYVMAISKATGKTEWKVDGIGQTAWSSPRLVDVGGGKQHLVLSASGSLTGLEPATGERLWTLDGLSGNTTPTPVPVGEASMLAGASAGRSESVSSEVFESNGLIRLTEVDGTWSAAFEWNGERASVSFSSPVAAADNAYFVNRSGVLTAVSMQDGSKTFSSRLEGTMWGTPIVIGQSVVFPLKEGLLQFVGIGDEFESQATHRIAPEPAESAGPFGGPILYGIAFGSDRIFARTGTTLVCVTPTYE